MKKVELIAPAGDKQKAYIAFRYGADAIYMGVAMFALRTRMNKITEEDISEILDFAHKNGKKVFITLNGFPHQNLLPYLRKHLQFLKKVRPDGLIIADTGVLYEANKICPDIPKHLSVQASTVSESGIKFWKSAGIKRVILAREIPISEVSQIKKMCPDIELEYFVHGAVCMAYSGRCLLSNFMASRDSNRGMCAHSCRWKYRIYDEEGREVDIEMQGDKNTKLPNVITLGLHGDSASIRDLEKYQIWEEELRQGELIPVEQDFHGTHIMSSRDMCMIEHLKDVIEGGVDSLKIEGRNKTIYYLATVIRAYRKAIDDYYEGKGFDQNLWNEIHATANRGFFAGFLHGKPNVDGQQYEANRSTAVMEFSGQVIDYYKKNDKLDSDLEGFAKGYVFKENTILIDPKNRIDSGSKLTFLYPDIKDDISIELSNFYHKGKRVDVIHGGDGNAWIELPDGVNIETGVLIRQEVSNEGLKK